MKSLMCTMCDYKTTKEDDDEVMNNLWEHIQEAHTEYFTKIMAMPAEEQEKMKEEARKMIKDEPEA